MVPTCTEELCTCSRSFLSSTHRYVTMFHKDLECTRYFTGIRVKSQLLFNLSEIPNSFVANACHMNMILLVFTRSWHEFFFAIDVYLFPKHKVSTLSTDYTAQVHEMSEIK